MRKLARLYVALCALLILLAATTVSFVQADTSNSDTLVAGNTRFAFKLYQTLGSGTSDNLVYSPYSVSEAFAMVYAGAHGDTEKVIRTTLEYSLPQTDVPSTFKLLNDDLMARGNHKPGASGDPSDLPRTLHLANGVWVEKTFPIKQAYQDQIKAAYGAGLQLADFVNAPQAEQDKINQWVQQQTEDRIKDIIPPGTLTPATRLVLANAIYFKESWQYPFGNKSTKPDTFFLDNGTSIQTPMMKMDEANPLAYVKDGDTELISLPYVDSGMSMVIVMPGQGKFADFEKSLDADQFKNLMDKLDGADTRQAIVHMPRFKFEFSADLGDKLTSLGMGPAFSGSADFSGISDQPLNIGAALHKAFISVDEKGTEAAAATVIMMVTSAPLNPPPILDVKIDRPFFFVIRDDNTHTVLFMGRVLQPVEG